MITISNEPAELPKAEAVKSTFTFQVPHILKSITKDEAGFFHKEIREGGSRQVEFETVTEFTEEKKEETPFEVKVTNQLNFYGSVINVINDEVVLEDFRLVPTVPTTSEYLAQVGKRTLVKFSCTLDSQWTKQMEKNIYRVTRSFITLP